MFKKIFLALFLVSSVPVSLVGCNKDEKKTEDSDKKKKDDSDDEDDSKSKKKKSEDSDEDDSKSKKKKKSEDSDDEKPKKKDEDGDSKKKEESGGDEDSVGVKACDDYLARYMKCMPGDKKTKTDTVKTMRDAWKQSAAVPAAKALLKDSCTKANDSLDKVPSCKP